MNRKLVAIAALAMMPFVPAQADNDIGCGLGTMIMEGQEGVIFKAFGATTNGTSGNQTFGITSGTLGCGSGKITASAQVVQFASANLDQLSMEMASGHGETMTALAELYNIDSGDRDAFYTAAKSNYGSIFADADATAGDVVSALQSVMAQDVRLSRYVS